MTPLKVTNQILPISESTRRRNPELYPGGCKNVPGCPTASQNENNHISPRPKPKQAVPNESMAKKEGKDSHSTRLHVRVTSFRRRLIDPDNLCPKYFIDCLRYCGWIPDDSAKQITLEVSQTKSHLDRTEIEILP